LFNLGEEFGIYNGQLVYSSALCDFWHTFFSPLVVELILGQLKVNHGASAKDVRILLLVVAKCVDLFTKWYPPRHPASLVSALQRQLPAANFALALSAGFSNDDTIQSTSPSVYTNPL